MEHSRSISRPWVPYFAIAFIAPWMMVGVLQLFYTYNGQGLELSTVSVGFVFTAYMALALFVYCNDEPACARQLGKHIALRLLKYPRKVIPHADFSKEAKEEANRLRAAVRHIHWKRRAGGFYLSGYTYLFAFWAMLKLVSNRSRPIGLLTGIILSIVGLAVAVLPK